MNLGCTPWSEWISVPAAGRRDWIAIPSALVTSAAVGGGVDRPAERPSRAGIQEDRAVQLAFAGGVLGDVGDPQLVGAGAVELTPDQVGGGRLRAQPTPELGAAGHAL